MLFNNAQACMSWLSYLQKECGAKPLFGEDLTRVAQQVWLYNCAGDMLNFYAEIPLLGPAGMDISCQYLASLFAKGNAFSRHELEQEGEKFHLYSQKLKTILPDTYDEKCMFLETDTSGTSNTKLSKFYQLQNGYAAKLLPFLLQQENYPDMLKEVDFFLKLLEPHAELWQLGFMQGRVQRPLRLVLHINENGLEACLARLKIPRYKEIIQLVDALVKDSIYIIDILDIDLLPGQGVGPVVGIELAAKRIFPAVQKQFVKTEAYQEFKQLLITKGLADQRIHCLERCIYADLAPDNFQAPYYLYSGINHFKLQWQQGEQLPAKAYLRMRTAELERSINKQIQSY